MGLFGNIIGLWFAATVAHSSGSVPVQRVEPTVQVIERSVKIQDQAAPISQQSNNDQPLRGTQDLENQTVALAGE